MNKSIEKQINKIVAQFGKQIAGVLREAKAADKAQAKAKKTAKAKAKVKKNPRRKKGGGGRPKMLVTPAMERLQNEWTAQMKDGIQPTQKTIADALGMAVSQANVLIKRWRSVDPSCEWPSKPPKMIEVQTPSLPEAKDASVGNVDVFAAITSQPQPHKNSEATS